MEHTGEQVLRGLAGLFLIDDEESRSLGLPSEYGVDDIPLVIQDRRFRPDGAFDYALSMPDVMMGYKGDVVLVNGTVSPYVDLRRQRTRLRILNGSNSLRQLTQGSVFSGRTRWQMTANTFLEFLGTRDGQSLIGSFSKIADVKLRRSVVDLVERLAAIGKSDPPKPRRARPKRK